MDRTFDHTQKILVAVEIAAAPRSLKDMPPGYTVFQRIDLAEVERAFDEADGAVAPGLDRQKFHEVANRQMGYWQARVPAGKGCYVHYAIGSEEVIRHAFERLERDEDGFTLLGVYHTEPQSSAYPASFPVGPAPLTWSLGEEARFTKESVFWFNFFPAQPHLFEKTFAIWVLFQMYQGRGRGEINLLCSWEGPERLRVRDVDPFVQVNLNRFTSIPGYFESAREAGKHTFTVDAEYTWYGMLLRRLA